MEFAGDLRNRRLNPSPAPRDVHREWKDTIAKGTKSQFEPCLQVFRKGRICLALPLNAPLDFDECNYADMQFRIRNGIEPLCYPGIALGLAQFGQNIRIEKVH